uniref:Uncharacterized protein n=1 Tax=Rhizophora mucronata TaxID=61149 RepID=A0A2P2QH27_RHIMU
MPTWRRVIVGCSLRWGYETSP